MINWFQIDCFFSVVCPPGASTLKLYRLPFLRKRRNIKKSSTIKHFVHKISRKLPHSNNIRGDNNGEKRCINFSLKKESVKFYRTCPRRRTELIRSIALICLPRIRGWNKNAKQNEAGVFFVWVHHSDEQTDK